MLPPDYRWESLRDGQALVLHGVAPYPCRCANWAPLPGGGGFLLHFGVRDGLPQQRTFVTEAVATRFAEAWALKWDTEIRRVVANKCNTAYEVRSPPPEVAKEAATRDHARRKGHRKDWWKKDPPAQA